MSITEINIDKDKPCTKCGQMGVMQNGKCMSCATDHIVDNLAGKIDLINNALLSASRQINAHLATHSLHIHKAYMGSEENKLSIGLTVELSPSEEVADEINVKAKINFIESRVKEESKERVSSQVKMDI